MARCLRVLPGDAGGRFGEVQRRRVVPGAAFGAVWAGLAICAVWVGLASWGSDPSVSAAASPGPRAWGGTVSGDCGCLDPRLGPLTPPA